MESTPVKFSFGEAPILDSRRLGIETLVSNSVVKKDKDKSIKTPNRQAVKPRVEAKLTELDTKEVQTKPATLVSEQEILFINTEIDNYKPTELHLPTPDEAWEIVNPNNQSTVFVGISELKVPSNVNKLTGAYVKTFDKVPESRHKKQPQVVGEPLLADGKIHDLPQTAGRLPQIPVLESQAIIIEHETEETISRGENNLDVVAVAQQYPELNWQTLPSHERPLVTIDREEALSASRTTKPNQNQTKPIEARSPDIKPHLTLVKAETRLAEHNNRYVIMDQFGSLFNWLISRGQKRQNWQEKEYLPQQILANEQPAQSISVPQPLAERAKFRMNNQLKKVINLFSRPEGEQKHPRDHIRYRAMERERELINERKQERFRMREIETMLSRNEKFVEKKPDVESPPLRTAVAETAIEQVLRLPPEHRLQKSAWLSIEVDKFGRAVERPVFAYGYEFQREQRHELRSYKAPNSHANRTVSNNR